VLRRILWFPIALVAAVLLVTLAVANRDPVRMVLDPFRPDAPVISMTLPFYAYLLGALTLGVILGGAATWFGQGRWRKTARGGRPPCARARYKRGRSAPRCRADRVRRQALIG
jgi:uncharacterized integral membrane protein